jgi:hypothetical protein
MENESYLELSARQQALSFLVEALYANMFADTPEKFTAVIREMQRLTIASPATDGPISTDQEREMLQELQIRSSAHLSSIEQSVLRHIRTRHKL